MSDMTPTRVAMALAFVLTLGSTVVAAGERLDLYDTKGRTGYAIVDRDSPRALSWSSSSRVRRQDGRRIEPPALHIEALDATALVDLAVARTA